MTLLTLIPLLILAALLYAVLRDRNADRESFAAERDKWTKERSVLLDRIAVPGVAHTPFEPTKKRQHVPFDDDEAYERLRINGDA